MSSTGVPTRFKSSTHTIIIENLISDFLIKTHGHIGLFAYPSFSNFSLTLQEKMSSLIVFHHQNKGYLLRWIGICICHLCQCRERVKGSLTYAYVKIWLNIGEG